MSYKDFANDFKKGIIGDVFFFYGAEDYLMDWAVSSIIEKYVDKEYGNLDVQYLDGESCTAADIMSAARSFSMFSEKRVIIVPNYLPAYKKKTDADADALIKFCSEKQGSTVTIFRLDSKYESEINAYGKKLIKAASSYDFAKLNKAELQSFINKRVHAAGKLIGHREMTYLIDLSGYHYKESEYNLAKLDKDLEKICAACEGDTVDNSLIEDLLIGEEDKYVFNLVDAIMAGNRSRAMELAEHIIREDDAAMSVLALLCKQFEIMYDSVELSREGYSLSEIAKRTAVNEFRLKKAYQAARSFNSDTLKKILIDIYNIDKDIKTGMIDKDVAFELLIASA